MKKIRVAINGLGRIGRSAFKVAWDNTHITIVAVNDLATPENLAYLLQQDSVYRRWEHGVQVEGGNLVIEGKKILVLQEKDPALLPWKKLKIDVVIESTGRFTNTEGLTAHLRAGAARAVLSAPAKGGGIPTYVRGVNEKKYHQEAMINNASCTTNCVGPVTTIMHQAFTIVKAAMTTVHAMTAEQSLVDGPMPPLHHDMRRGRSAGYNIVPTTTGAATATTEAIPELAGKFDGMALRVPVACGSLSDFTFLVKKKTTAEEVNRTLSKAAKNPLWKGILEVTNEPLVSTDIIGTRASAIMDLGFTKVIDGDLVKVLAWYDNEYGYANRLVEMVEQVGKSI